MKFIKSLTTTALALFMLASCCEKEVYLFSGHREPALGFRCKRNVLTVVAVVVVYYNLCLMELIQLMLICYH